MNGRIQRISVIDSHTGGEPTRVVIRGVPDLGTGTVAERSERFARNHDRFRSAIVNEPRGSDVLVGAMLLEPLDPTAVAGVLFFNNVGVLGMCGHGTIGLIVTLAYLNRITTGTHRLETPVGDVTATLHHDGRVSVCNVPSYRLAESIAVEVPGYGQVTGNIAWGGNWFFLVEQHAEPLLVSNTERLTNFTWAIRQSLEANKIFGVDGGIIDHIELFGPPHDPANHSRNFVLCPGKAYDRSPCGTGTSAKLACLAADGKLKPGEIWRQESILGSVFEGSYLPLGSHRIVPTITGRAWITAESTLILDDEDPLRDGVRT